MIEPSVLTDQQQSELAEAIFAKEYTSAALPFLKNPSRALNYWRNGVDIMPDSDFHGGHAKFSFFEILWLYLVNELRSFGFQKEEIAILKDEILKPIDHEKLLSEIQTHKHLFETELPKIFGDKAAKIEAILEQYVTEHQKALRLKSSQLFSYTFYSLGMGEVVRLLVNNHGKHLAYHQSLWPGGLAEIEAAYPAFGKKYIVICLTDLIGTILSWPSIKDELKQPYFSENEWKIIQIIRKEKLQSLTVHFDTDGKEHLVELKSKKKIDTEARLSEIMLKGAYQEIEVKTQGGMVTNCYITEKRKL